MDWDHLRVFLAVARSGQMLAAARRLGLNHATVARRLEALEHAIGAPLFERRPTGAVLTQSGERLLPVAERIEFDLLGLTEALKNEGAQVSGTVRIGVPDGLGNYFLAAELGELTRRHPELIVELVPLPRTFSLSRREADLAIVLDPPSEGRLLVSRLIDYTLSVFASRDYLDKAGVPSAVEDLSTHVVVTGVEDYTYSNSLDYTSILEKNARSRFRCASVVGQVEAVKAGTGIGILHDFAANNMESLVRILPQITYRRSYYLLLHPDSSAIRRIATVRDYVTRRFREERLRFAPGVQALDPRS